MSAARRTVTVYMLWMAALVSLGCAGWVDCTRITPSPTEADRRLCVQAASAVSDGYLDWRYLRCLQGLGYRVEHNQPCHNNGDHQ